MVGNGDAVRVTAQVLENVLRSSERWFAVHHPVLSEERTEKASKGLGLSDGCQGTGELESVLGVGTFQSGSELAPKDPAQHSDGQKERVPRMDPARAVA